MRTQTHVYSVCECVCVSVCVCVCKSVYVCCDVVCVYVKEKKDNSDVFYIYDFCICAISNNAARDLYTIIIYTMF